MQKYTVNNYCGLHVHVQLILYTSLKDKINEQRIEAVKLMTFEFQ